MSQLCYDFSGNGDNLMSKSAMVRARLEPDLKVHKAVKEKVVTFLSGYDGLAV